MDSLLSDSAIHANGVTRIVDCHPRLFRAPALNDPNSYRPDIDGLRALAVISVIGFHVSGRFVPGGFVGVDVFFTLSGFLISTIIFRGLDTGRFSFAGFYERRIRRIFPALILVLLAVWALGWYALMAEEYEQLGKHISAGAGFVSNMVLWRQSGYFWGDAELKPLLHLWSLGVEEQFYLLWPLIVFLAWKTRVNRLKLLVGVWAVSLVMNVGTVGFSPETAFYLPHTRFWELMMGSVLAHISLYRHDEFEVKLNRKFRVPFSGFELPFREIMAGLGICFILAGVVFLDKASPFPGYWALLPTGGAFFSIAAGPRTWINRNILSCRFMIFVGVISYPLYLWHWPLLSFARIVEAGEPSLAVKLAAVALAVLLAWLTYQLVEKRIRFGMTGSGTRRVVLLLASGMAVAFGVGVVTVKTHGLPRRYPDAIRRLSQYKAEEHASSWRDGKCFLQPDQDWHKFDTSCYDVQPQSAPLLLLWGDSHAADLYPGLKHLQSDYTFRIAQYTSSFCPPIFNFKNPQRKLCENNNIWLRRQIQELHPQIVVLAAQYWFLDSPDVHNKISSTLAILKKAGVQTVIVVGPNPEWKEPLPRALFDSYYRATSFHTIPDRMLYQLDDSIFPIDRRLRTWVSESDASYVSPVGILCNQTGCLTQLHESGTSELTSFDRHHLTDRASQYVAKLMFAPLFTQVSPRIPMK